MSTQVVCPEFSKPVILEDEDGKMGEVGLKDEHHPHFFLPHEERPTFDGVGAESMLLSASDLARYTDGSIFR